MDITRESILGVGMDTSLVHIGWLRQHTPDTQDGKEKLIDSVEFEINHKGIEKLERNIHSKTEYVMCFVHFDADTENLDGIYMSVWDEEDCDTDDSINSNILDTEEKKIILDYALKELREERKYIEDRINDEKSVLKAGTYKVEIELTLDEDVEETALDSLFTEAMYNNYDCTAISSSSIGKYIPVAE